MIYGPDEQFPIGGSKVVRQSDNDQVTVVGAGITLHEALKAYDQLQGEGITIRVIDAYSVKPIDAADAARGRRRRPTGASSWSRTTGPRAAWATRCSTPSPGPRRRAPSGTLPQVVKLAVHQMPGSAHPGAGDRGRRHQREPHRRGGQVAAGVNAGIALLTVSIALAR